MALNHRIDVDLRRTIGCVVAIGTIGLCLAWTGTNSVAGASSRPTTVDAPRKDPSLVDCIGNEPPETYGPTDINAQTGNGGLSVALNRQGTVTVLRWPSPSYYNQVRYKTSSRDKPHLGAADDEGMFLGLEVTDTHGRTTTTWLRDWKSRQSVATGWTDEVQTTYTNADLHLVATVDDVVDHPSDVLARQVKVRKQPGAAVRRVRLVSFENVSLVVSKKATLPVQDWCFASQNTDTTTYDADLGAVIHTRSGTDESTGKPSGAALAVGFGSKPDDHVVGGDSQASGPPSALADADAGTFDGADHYSGQTTSAVATTLTFHGKTAGETLYVAAAPNLKRVGALLRAARARGFDAAAKSKRKWLTGILENAPLPNTNSAAVQALARRALVTLITDTDRKTGAIVASIATQSPYGEDWPRDGAFFDYTLDLLGLHDRVAAHLNFYDRHQQTKTDPDPEMTKLDIPAGNWAMNYYADGVVGGPIPWEIDETGYQLWDHWEHFKATGDTADLRRRYPTISAAANFLVTCRDADNGLQCPAHEDDHFAPSQTLVGATTTWLGLDGATQVAKALDKPADAKRWAARRDGLGKAIDSQFWKGDQWGKGSAPLAWPACFQNYDSPRMQQHLAALRTRLAKSFAEPAAGQKKRGQYESKGLIALAKADRDDPAAIKQVRGGLNWVATEAATPDTHILGEAWQRRGDEIVTEVSQPHAWEQVLFYLAALEAWPPAKYADTPVGCEGVLGAIRSDAHPGAGPSSSGGPTATSDQSSQGILIGVIGAGVLLAIGGVGFILARRHRAAER